MDRFVIARLLVGVACTLLTSAMGWSQPVAPSSAEPGLVVSFQNGEGQPLDRMVVPGLSLFVPAGESPSPFVAPGPFKAVWTGQVTVELRGEYQFYAEVQGQFTLEINGRRVLESTSVDRVGATDAVRLAKGTNLLTATFINPATGDGSVRLFWVPKGGLPTPIPLVNLSHLTSSIDLQQADEIRLGRELFFEHRCGKCHLNGPANAHGADSDLDAPSFDGIGRRRRLEWLVNWIADPKALRPLARMPRLLSGTARAQAQDIAAFLSSVQPAASQPQAQESFSPEQKEAGHQLFDKLQCIACHDAPGAPASDPTRISLRGVAQKFAPGSLTAFLQQPEADFHWIRMPNFKLTVEEATSLAAYLMANADAPTPAQATPNPDAIQRGRALVQTSGCLNCHALKLENRFATKPVQALPPDWQTGCLQATPSPESKAAFYAFSTAERKALQAFGRADRSALGRDAPAEFAQRSIRALRCTECHGKVEGFPSLDALGGKLKPEWSGAFISGTVKDRPRPWLEVRMPAFPAYGQLIARGMAMLHGYPPHTPSEGPVDRDAARIGQRLVSAEGGLSCISCHAVARVKATQVFENAGINLAFANARLLKPYFERWVRNPLAIDPVSKMPMFFDEQLRSPLVEFYDGDGRKQIEALWQYTRLGDQMPPPPGTEPSP